MMWLRFWTTLGIVTLVLLALFVYAHTCARTHHRPGYEHFQEIVPASPAIPTGIIAELGLEPYSKTWQTDSVPLLLHQTAPSDKSKWHNLWRPCQESWIKKCSHYAYCMWNDEDVADLIKKRYPKFLPTFQAYDVNIKRVDAFRYFLLYEYGGLYADMDYECVRNFDHTLAKGKVSIAESTFENEKYQNALMASPPRHPFWLYVFETLLKRPGEYVVVATGPKLIDDVVASAPVGMFNALPKDGFSVIEPFESSRATEREALQENKWENHPKVYAVHHCTASWIE
jgi:mannosyltransferase OCH1-like enzyme